MVINEFGGREIDCDQAGDGEFGDACPFSGDEVIRALGYDGLSVGLCGAMLITIALAARGGLPLPPTQHHAGRLIARPRALARPRASHSKSLHWVFSEIGDAPCRRAPCYFFRHPSKVRCLNEPGPARRARGRLADFDQPRKRRAPRGTAESTQYLLPPKQVCMRTSTRTARQKHPRAV